MIEEDDVRAPFSGEVEFSGLSPELESRCELLGKKRLEVAATCSEWIQLLEDSNMLPDMWRREGYSRSVSEKKGVPAHFKDAEDVGDRKMRDVAVGFFDRCVAKKYEEPVDLKTLLQMIKDSEELKFVERINGDIGLETFAPVMFRAEDGWGESFFPFQKFPIYENGDLHAIVVKIKGENLKRLFLSTSSAEIQGLSFDKDTSRISYSWGLDEDFMQFQTKHDKQSFLTGTYEILSVQHVKSKDIFAKDFAARMVEPYDMQDAWILIMRLVANTILCGQAIRELQKYEEQNPDSKEKFIVGCWGVETYYYVQSRRPKNDEDWLVSAAKWYQSNLRGAFTEATNWTVALNFCTDLLGIDERKNYYKKGWREEYGHIFPIRLPVKYLSRSYKSSHKKEANMLEALIGSLFMQEDYLCDALAQMLTFLAVICVVFPPRNIPPSNHELAVNWNERETRRPIGSDELSKIPELISIPRMIQWLLVHARNFKVLRRDMAEKESATQQHQAENQRRQEHVNARQETQREEARMKEDSSPPKYPRLERESSRRELEVEESPREGGSPRRPGQDRTLRKIHSDETPPLRKEDVVWKEWDENKEMYWCLACKKCITETHLSSMKHQNNLLWYVNEELIKTKPLPSWVQIRNGSWRYCTLCNAYIDTKHISSAVHKRRESAWRVQYGHESEPELMLESSEAGEEESSSHQMLSGDDWHSLRDESMPSTSGDELVEHPGIQPRRSAFSRAPRPY